MKYKRHKDGEWIQPLRKWKLMCCDCGLVHDINFRLVGGPKRFTIQLQAFRNERATALSRRARKTKKGKR